MKTAVLVLGIIGGIIGLIAVPVTFFGSAVLAGLGVKLTFEQTMSKCLWLTVFSILGIVGGALTKTKREVNIWRRCNVYCCAGRTYDSLDYLYNTCYFILRRRTFSFIE